MTKQANNQQGPAGDGNGDQPGSNEALENLLEDDADGDNDGGDGTGGDGGDGGDGEGEGGAGPVDIRAAVREALADLLPQIQDQTTREIDRRVNGALAKVRKPGAGNQQQQDDGGAGGDSTMPGKPAADIRGARIAFREYLPEQIRFLSPEEKALATEFGLNALKAAALNGFTDEDAAGKEAAAATVKFIKSSRTYYSARTKKALEKQGALIVKDGSGQTSHGTTPPGNVQSAFDKAAKKMEELGMKPRLPVNK
jgi:hypothetical protein